MTVDVMIEEDAWTGALPDAAADVRAAAQAALERASPSAAASEVSVLLTSDAAVREMNARFRGKDAETNVLSFPCVPTPAGVGMEEASLGDVALAYGVCAAEALAQGKPLRHHMQHLVVHGVLHLLSFDHESDAEAEEMEAVERTVLAQLGVPDPYEVAP